jgi:hypothetical protein
MEKSSLQDLNLDFGLSGEFLLRLDDFKGNKLLFFMIKGFEYFSKRASANILYYFILIGYGISDHDFRFPFRIGKIACAMNAPFANIKDFKLVNFLLFKRGYFFLTLWPLGGRDVSGLGWIILFGGVLQDSYLSFVYFIANSDDVFVGILSESLVFG